MSTKEKPAPLVPAGVDLRSLEYMPMYIARLTNSKTWLITKRKPELFRPLFALWLRAWQAVPAGSLEDDDDILAHAADLTFDQWIDAKDDLTRGWVLCSDGRYYIPSMVPMVQMGWLTVCSHKKRAKAGAYARWGKVSEHPQGMPQVSPTDDSRHASKHPSKDATAHPKDGRKDGWNKGNGAERASKNNTLHPRQAALDLMTSIRNKQPPADPTTAQVVDAMGGFQRLCSKTDSALIDLMRDFEARYAAAQH